MKSVEMLPSRYRIERKLGEGGFGQVFKAYDSNLKQTLAIKILPENVIATQETLTREFETLAKLQHPNLVSVFDYGILPPHTPYFTMEFVEGENLRNFLGSKANIPCLPKIIRQALSALSYLNKKRILHGDLKPENIMIKLGEDGDIDTKLLDFGLTSSLDDERRLLSGTVQYLAPEIFLHGCPKSPATDLYALGASFIESILSREIPRSDAIDQTYLEKVHAELNESLTKADLRNPSALSSFILDLCRPDPVDRANDAKDASRSFEMIASDSSPRQELQMNSLFVGRKQEIKEIDSLLTDAGSRKQAIILSGAQGIGKQSIMGKAAQSAQLNGFLPMNLTPLSSHFSIDRLAEALASHLSTEEKKRLFSNLPAWEKHDGGRGKTDLDPNNASVIFARIIDFLAEMASSRPILIMISDTERGSEDFLRFIVQLLKQMETSRQRIYLLITSSTGLAQSPGVSEAMSRIARSPLAAQIEVLPFNDELLKKYLTACFGRLLLPEKERRDLLSKTQGIPLLIAAFLKSLITSNVIQYEDGYWLLDRKRYKQVRIPTDIDQSLASTLINMREEQTALMRLLALAGPLPKSDLTRFARGIIGNPELATDDLTQKAILVHRGDGTIAFAHPLYSQFIIENAPPDTLREFSAQLAASLALSGSSDSLRVAQLYIGAEQVDEAIEHGLAAVDKMFSSYLLYDCLKLLLDLKDLAARKGNKSHLLAVLEKLAPIEQRTGLPKEAINDYKILVNAAKGDAQKAEYYMQLAEIHNTLLGNNKIAYTLLQKALQKARKANDAGLMASVYRLLASLDLTRSAFFFEKAADLSRKGNFDLHLMSLASLAYSYQRAGKAEKASLIQNKVLRELHKADSTAKRMIYYDFYWLSFYTADYKAARYYITKKIQLERKTENSLKLLSSMSALAGCYYTEGSYYKMIDALNEIHRSAMRYNSYLNASIALSNLSLGYRSVADYGQSLKMLLEAEEINKREGIQTPNTAYLNKSPMLYLVFGNSRDVEFKTSVRRLYERARKSDNGIGLGHHSMAFALHHQYKLESDEALPHAKKALSFFRKAADRDDVVNALILTAIIQISRGKPKLARPHLNEAEELYDTIHCEYLKPFLMLGRGMLARVEHSDEGDKILSEALRTSKKMGTRETTWQIQRELALYHKDRGEPHKVLAYYRDAVETIKQITETIDEEELKMSYLQVPFRKRVIDEIKRLNKEKEPS